MTTDPLAEVMTALAPLTDADALRVLAAADARVRMLTPEQLGEPTPRCRTCGLPLPDPSQDLTAGPEQPFLPGVPTVCLLDHGAPTWREQWRAWRERRRQQR